MNEKYSEDMCCQREIVTKEKLYERLNDAIRHSVVVILKEEARLDVLTAIRRSLDEYFEDLDRN